MEENKETVKDIFSSWLKELEDKDQPEVCNIESEECENCGS